MVYYPMNYRYNGEIWIVKTPEIRTYSYQRPGGLPKAAGRQLADEELWF